LGRDVAIKVLPDAFAQDPGRLARFEREAKTLASLNHPNIAIIYGLEKADGNRALVMELVEGRRSPSEIAKGPLPIPAALPIAKQIAAALEAAHEQGIVHRDLKPANIKLRTDGTVKVLDFGVAKAMEPAGAAVNATLSPTTITTPAMTQAGAVDVQKRLENHRTVSTAPTAFIALMKTPKWKGENREARSWWKDSIVGGLWDNEARSGVLPIAEPGMRARSAQ
jgi:serine/threonine protein kinase